MQYAVLGRTGLKVSRLGFGAMRLPMAGGAVNRELAIPMIHRAFEKGVNYIDTAVGYCNSDSQRAVGEALKGWREKIVVSTKNPHYNRADDRGWWQNLEDSLERLNVEYIDVYNFHGLGLSRFKEHLAGPGGQLEWAKKARDQGLIKHICFSFHDTAAALKTLAETGEFESVTLQYNLLDRSNEPAFDACRKAGMGIVVMGPVGGGRLGMPSEKIQKIVRGAKSVPEVALRFVLANPNVTVALSGMGEMKHVEENIRVASKTTPLSTAEKRQVDAALKQFKKLADLYCTGCNYCMPCPAGVNIPANFSALNYVNVYGLPQVAKGHYARLANAAAVHCKACGQCVPKCPQNIRIIEQLQETVRNLDEAYGKVMLAMEPTAVRDVSCRNGKVNAAIDVRLNVQNLSDQPLESSPTFAPADGLSVDVRGKFPTLGSFERKSLRLTVTAKKVPVGEPMPLNPCIGLDGQMLLDGDPLVLCVASPASTRTVTTKLRTAVPLAANELLGDASPRTAKTRSLTAGLVYTDEAFVAELVLDGTLRPTPAGKPVGAGDYVWIRPTVLSPKAKPGREIAVVLRPDGTWKIGSRRGQFSEAELKAMMVRESHRGKKRVLRITVPWSVLGVRTPLVRTPMDFNVGWAVHRPNGQLWQRVWQPKPERLFLGV